MPKLTIEKLYRINGAECEKLTAAKNVGCYQPKDDKNIIHVVTNGDVIFTLEVNTLNPTQVDVSVPYVCEAPMAASHSDFTALSIRG